MKIKILFIMGCLDNGGGERSLINLLQLLDYTKYEVDLILFKKRGIFLKQVPKQVNIINDCTVLNFVYDNSVKSCFTYKYPIKNFIRICGTLISKIISKSGFNKGQIRWKYFYRYIIPEYKKNYDVAISYLEGETTYFLVDKILAKKKIAWVHTDYSKINTDIDFDYLYFNKVSKIVGISEACTLTLINMYPDFKNKIVLLPNLICSKVIKNLANEFVPKEYVSGKCNIVSIGRLVYLKGFDLAIQVAAILKSKGIEFNWIVLGSGELEFPLKKMVKKYSLDNQFSFIGSRENPYPYIKNADILVQCSRYEGKSMVLDETKILAKPIVVTNYDTIKDQILDNEGIIVGFEPEKIYAGIIQALQQKEKLTNFLLEHEYGNENKIYLYDDLFCLE